MRALLKTPNSKEPKTRRLESGELGTTIFGSRPQGLELPGLVPGTAIQAKLSQAVFLPLQDF